MVMELEAKIFIITIVAIVLVIGYQLVKAKLTDDQQYERVGLDGRYQTKKTG